MKSFAILDYLCYCYDTLCISAAILSVSSSLCDRLVCRNFTFMAFAITGYIQLLWLIFGDAADVPSSSPIFKGCRRHMTIFIACGSLFPWSPRYPLRSPLQFDIVLASLFSPSSLPYCRHFSIHFQTTNFIPSLGKVVGISTKAVAFFGLIHPAKTSQTRRSIPLEERLILPIDSGTSQFATCNTLHPSRGKRNCLCNGLLEHTSRHSIPESRRNRR